MDLLFCVSRLAVGKFVLGLDTAALQTLTVATLVYWSQAVFFVARERQHFWSSRPGRWLILSSVIDVSIITGLALTGVLMAPLAPAILADVALAAVVFTVVMDTVKWLLFRHLQVA